MLFLKDNLLQLQFHIVEGATGPGITEPPMVNWRDDLTAEGYVLLAHNEDWISVDRDHIYLVHAEPDRGPAFIGMTYGLLMLSRFCLSVVGTRFPMSFPASRSSSWDENGGSGESLSRPTR